MTQEQINRQSACLYRLFYLNRMQHWEYEQFLKLPAPSGIKNALYRGKQVYASVLEQLRTAMPVSKNKLEAEMNMSEEKIRALSTIFEKLCALEEADVLAMEDEFNKSVTVNYGEGEKV